MKYFTFDVTLSASTRAVILPRGAAFTLGGLLIPL